MICTPCTPRQYLAGAFSPCKKKARGRGQEKSLNVLFRLFLV